MRNEYLESNLIKIFSQFTEQKKDYLVEKIEDNRLTIKETDERGKCEVSFKNGPFIRFSEKMLGTNKFINFFNKQKGTIVRRICDGIFLVPLKELSGDIIPPGENRRISEILAGLSPYEISIYDGKP